ncbi:response regulator transcription factor [Salipaludibacillus agaradhaerens]|uniref:response regulator transcription factor n=1 Tax=Salipaludibacillus agaradhaerens TaxID=76935 RepID=UPI002151DBEA|nr:LuxR C-terminal-related transcriptional regulator [Salipaludibacillus agaradhaerens]MCR6106842.1 response regulator transcription factor [Salipaludibacillus agaradhaerens]MCR6118874.1 response regulator transcription factor [Salipaludibacillus agaradhaerens]UJW57948.1 response regulator transcription factor [Bacillus sp. A116_S68]
MFSTNEKLLKTMHYNVMFTDPKNLFPQQVMNAISGWLETNYMNKVAGLAVNNKKNWIFVMVEGYDEKTFESLKQLQLNTPDSPTVLVVKSPVEHEILSYLSLPLNGLVSLDFLKNHSHHVMDAIMKNGVFLETSLHRDLSIAIENKKSYTTPIKRFILNEKKITIPLNERDRQVLQLLLDGLSNSEIATKLHFARSTISSIISALLKKMKANDRTDATVKAIRFGWVDAIR